MIGLKDFLGEKGLPFDNINNILICFMEHNSFLLLNKYIELYPIQIDEVVNALSDYLELCKDQIINASWNKRERRDLIEMVELLGGLICALHIFMESEK